MLFQKLSGKRANNANNISPGAPKTLWSWGFNSGAGAGGEVGDTTVISRSSPVQLGTLATWSILSTGGNNYASMAIKNDNTLWAWGSNTNGQLGLADTYKRSSPVQVGTLGTWASVSIGSFSTVATKTDGTLWAWGINTYGRLGVGDTVSRSSPAQVGTLATWSLVNAARFSVMATKTDGTLWSWGYNTRGNLGHADVAHRSSPVQIGTLTGWSKIASGGNANAFAIRDNGTLWAWGSQASAGVLGLGDAIYRSSPTQIGTLTGWRDVDSDTSGGMAIRTDGTLWMTGGRNFQGQMGIGDILYRSSPVQVGTLTNWASTHGGWLNRFGLRTDGTLWAWGSNVTSNRVGGLGLGDAVDRSSPTQIGTLTSWQALGGGAYYSFQALRL